MSYTTFHDYKAHSIKTVTIWCGSIIVRLMANWNKRVQRVRKFLRLIASSKRFLDTRKLSQHHNLSNILYLDCFCYCLSYLNKMCRRYSHSLQPFLFKQNVSTIQSAYGNHLLPVRKIIKRKIPSHFNMMFKTDQTFPERK